MDNGRREPRRMRYSLESRLRIVRLIERGETPATGRGGVARVARRGTGCGGATNTEGWQGLADRRWTPRRQPRRLSDDEEAQIVALRRELGAGPQVLARDLSAGRPRRSARCCAVPAARACHDRAGRAATLRARASRRALARRRQEARPLLAGRQADPARTASSATGGVGWSYLHIAIDDHTRLAYAELRPTSAAPAARVPATRPRLVCRARDHARTRGLDRQRQGLSRRLLDRCLRRARDRTALHQALQPVDERQSRSADQNDAPRMGLPPHLPDSSHRARALAGYLSWYNNHRPHGSLGARPPISRVSHVRGYST